MLWKLNVMSDMRQTLLLCVAAAMGLAACTKEETEGGRLPEGEYPLVINATGLQAEVNMAAARATVDGNWDGVTSVALQVGDEVREYGVATTDAENKTATLSSNLDPFYWTSREDITVSAWWPCKDEEGNLLTTMPDVVVEADQSYGNAGAFEASDCIAAIDQTVKFDNPTLEFTHRTARVTVNLQAGVGIEIGMLSDAEVKLTNLSTANGNPTAITAYNPTNTDIHEALVAPQTVAKNAAFIQVELHNGGVFYFQPKDDVVLEANHCYVYTVRVTGKGLELAGCTISDWADGKGEEGEATLEKQD